VPKVFGREATGELLRRQHKKPLSRQQ
jgi:hypothetical protein